MSIERAMYGNVWILPVKLKAGTQKRGHQHEFDHIHQVISGSGTIICYSDLEGDNILYKKVITEGNLYRVPKEHIHQIDADQGVDYHGNCIHALRHEDGSVVSTDMIKDINAGKIEFTPDETNTH